MKSLWESTRRRITCNCNLPKPKLVCHIVLRRGYPKGGKKKTYLSILLGTAHKYIQPLLQLYYELKLELTPLIN